MDSTFLTELRIDKVRHLHDITIPLSRTERKNLVLTGKNGSGKTSVLEELAKHLDMVVSGQYVPIREYSEKAKQLELAANELAEDDSRKRELISLMHLYLSEIHRVTEHGSRYDFCAEWTKCEGVDQRIRSGQFIVAYYGDSRKLDVTKVDHIEKVQLKQYYGIHERPSAFLGKYLVDLESTKFFARGKGDYSRATRIEDWFTRFEGILRRIYGEPSLKLDFNIDTFQFSILIDGREPFDFNTMSMGYAAVFDIVADLMMRMESQRRYDLEGIVLIDEIETHLHVELQKQIVPILTELFPNIQFILTTHSPFILNSAPNAVIYDLEKHLLVSEGMKNLSYEGIVEGYFGVDRYSTELRNAFEEYKALVTSDSLSDVQRARLAALRDYLDEVPDYLAREIAYEYSLLRLEYDD